MSSLYKGLAEYHRSQLSLSQNLTREGEVFIAQVLGLWKDGTPVTIGSSNQTTEDLPIAVGAIRFNRANISKKPEDTVPDIAEPLDRGSYRLPMIGEQVLVTYLHGRYYYFQVVSSTVSMLLNIDPNLLENEYESTSEPRIAVDPEIQRLRFDARTDFKADTLQPKQKSGLFSKVREGETILEGRMGGVIKLTHTITKEGVWDKDKQIANLGTSYDGDSMLLMKANIRRKSVEDLGLGVGSLEDDDINEDLSSFYLTTSQLVPMQIASSKKLFSWTTDITRTNVSAAEDEATARLQQLFPDGYDPSDVVQVNVYGLETVQTGGSAGGQLGGPGVVVDPTGTRQQTSDNIGMFTALDATAPKTSEYLFGAPMSSILAANGKTAVLPKSSAHGGRAGVGNNWESNNAWDIHVRPGTPVYAVAGGTVLSSRKAYDPPYIWGWMTTIGTTEARAFYTHLDHMVVSKGQSVVKGQLIGFVGEFYGHKPDEHFHHLHMGLFNRKQHPGDDPGALGPWNAKLSDFVDLQTGLLVFPF
jgi:murein DD-endopeptidase MepM/ murein hydrolase activator NlpD